MVIKTLIFTLRCRQLCSKKHKGYTSETFCSISTTCLLHEAHHKKPVLCCFYRFRSLHIHVAYFVLCRTIIHEKIDMLNQFLSKQSKYRKSGINMSTFLNKKERYASKMNIAYFRYFIKLRYVY